MEQFKKSAFFNAEKSEWKPNGHGKIVFTTEDNVDIVTGQKRHALKVMELLEQGKDADAIAFANSSVVKSGYQHRNTTQSRADKAEQNVADIKAEIEHLRAEAERLEKVELQKAEAEAERLKAEAEAEKERKAQAKAQAEKNKAERRANSEKYHANVKANAEARSKERIRKAHDKTGNMTVEEMQALIDAVQEDMKKLQEAEKKQAKPKKAEKK